jgi:integrase/recombinase XerD
MPISTYRRHLKTCPHAAKGIGWSLCDCPIWAYGTLPSGQKIRKSLGTASREKANEIADMLEAGRDPYWLQQAPDPAPAQRTVGDAVTAFLETWERNGAKPSTLVAYRHTFQHLPQSVALAGLNVEAHAATRKVKPSTLRKELLHLRTWLGWCVERGWVQENAAKKVRVPREATLTTLPFTSEEVTRLLAACDRILQQCWRPRTRALILTLLYTGLRISDVARLRRSALDGDGYLTLRVLKTGVPIKLLLHPSAREALNALPPIEQGVYFFWSGDSKLATVISHLETTVRRVGKLADVENAHPHRFRDSFAVELLTRGADIRTVQMLLGHTSVRTTEKHYAHFVAAHQELLDSASARLDFQPKPGRPLLVKPLHNRMRNAK